MAATSPELKRVKSSDVFQWTKSRKEIDTYLQQISRRDNDNFWALKTGLLDYWSEDHVVLPKPSTSTNSSGNDTNTIKREDSISSTASEATGSAAVGQPAPPRPKAPLPDSPPSQSWTPTQPKKGNRPRPTRDFVGQRDLPTLTLPSSFGRRFKRLSVDDQPALKTSSDVSKGAQTARGPRREEAELDLYKKIRSEKRRSVGFNHSWEFNNIDITHDFVIEGIGNVHTYLQKKWDNAMPLSPDTNRRRQLYVKESESAARLRQSVADFARASQIGYSSPSPIKMSNKYSPSPPGLRRSDKDSDKGDKDNESKSSQLPAVTFAEFAVPRSDAVTKSSSSPNIATINMKGSTPAKRTDSNKDLSALESGEKRNSDSGVTLTSSPSKSKRSDSESSVKIVKSDSKRGLDAEKASSSPPVVKIAMKDGVKAERGRDGTISLLRAPNEVGSLIIVAGTKDALVTSLTTDKASKSLAIWDMTIKAEEVDRDFTALFLLTHGSMGAMTSHELLKYLISLYWGKEKKKLKNGTAPESAIVKRRFLIVDILNEWLEKYYYHFATEAMSDLIKKFLKDISKGSDQEKEWHKILKETVHLKSSELQNRESLVFLARQVIGESAKLKGKNVKSRKQKKPRKAEDETKYGADGRNIQFVEIDYKILAEQIVLLDVASMSSLQPQHLLGDLSLRDDAAEIQRVRKMSFNITHWVAGEIVTTMNIKQRTIVLQKFVELCVHLYHMRDYEGFLNVYRGLTKYQVSRLQGTWRGIPQSVLDPFENIKMKMDTKGVGSFFDMTIVAESPKIPPLSLLLDLLDLEKAVPETYEDTDLVNFSKYRSIGHLLMSLHTAEWFGFFFDPIDPIQMFLQKHLTVISDEELTAASEKIQKRKANEKSAASKEKPVIKKESSGEKADKRKSNDKIAPLKKAAVTMQERKITESKSEVNKRLHLELVAKWERPLAQLSVHADVPRMVNKVLVINKKTGPPTIWPVNGEVASSSLSSIRGYFESLHRGMGHPELVRVPEFVSNLNSTTPEAEIDLQQNVNVYLATMTENDPFVKLLKAACSQGIVAPVWMFLKMFMLSGHSFKDVKLGWLIYVVFEGQFVHIIHQKKEQSNHDEEDPPRTPGEYDFEFTWELKMTFDLDFDKMISIAFGISSFTCTKHCDASLAKKLEKKVKGWRIESFLTSEQSIIEKAKAGLNSARTQTSFAPSTYDDFRKAVAKESGAQLARAESAKSDLKKREPGAKSSPRKSPRKSAAEDDTKERRRLSINDSKMISSSSNADLPSVRDEGSRAGSGSVGSRPELEREKSEEKAAKFSMDLGSAPLPKSRRKSPSTKANRKSVDIALISLRSSEKLDGHK